MKRFGFLTTVVMLLMSLTVACVDDNDFILPDNGNEQPNEGNDDKDDGKGDEEETPTPQPPVNGDYPDSSWASDGMRWVFDMEALPEIHIEVSEEEWNRLLEEYDRNSDTNAYIHCDVDFESKGESHSFEDAGLRLRGNTSRRRPEGNGG
ncbi:MAG: hypothetical protein J6Q21_03680, partial [Alistipes sp.]|nr:hypothetical protein [Alistipes sp.]